MSQININPGWLRRIANLAWMAIVLAAAFTGFQQLFSTFAPYDDEGYAMISLQSFLSGRPLYDETFSQYGPAYYFVQAAIHGGLRLAITHEIVRWKCLAFWIGTAAMCSLCVYRLTRCRLIAAAAMAGVFLHLDKLPLEPGHPQELGALLTASLLALATVDWPRSTGRGVLIPLGMGVLCGVAIMTKINVGLFLSLGVGISLVTLAPSSTYRTIVMTVISAACLVMPIFLFRNQLCNADSISLPLITCLAIASALVAASYVTRLEDRPVIPMQSFWYFIGGATATICLLVVMTLLHGTTRAGLFYGMVGQHAGFTNDFFHTPVLTRWGVVAAGTITLLLAGGSNTSVRFQRCRLLAIGLLGFCAITYLLESKSPPVHGLQERGAMGLLASFSPALLWLLLIPGSKQNAFPLLGRFVLTFTAILQPLIMFPTPGTQVAAGTFPLLLGGLILLHDYRVHCDGSSINSLARMAISQFATVLPLLLTAAIVVRGICFFEHRSRLVPMDLPGTGPLRLPAERVLHERQFVAELNSHADTFVFANHGRNSLYFWTQKKPPTGLNATFWRFLLTESQQKIVVEELSKYPRACVVYEESPIGLPGGPLVDYLEQQFEPLPNATRSGQLWVRKGRQP